MTYNFKLFIYLNKNYQFIDNELKINGNNPKV